MPPACRVQLLIANSFDDIYWCGVVLLILSWCRLHCLLILVQLRDRVLPKILMLLFGLQFFCCRQHDEMAEKKPANLHLKSLRKASGGIFLPLCDSDEAGQSTRRSNSVKIIEKNNVDKLTACASAGKRQAEHLSSLAF